MAAIAIVKTSPKWSKVAEQNVSTGLFLATWPTQALCEQAEEINTSYECPDSLTNTHSEVQWCFWSVKTIKQGQRHKSVVWLFMHTSACVT